MLSQLYPMEKISHSNCTRPKCSKNPSCVEDVWFAITENELVLKYQDASDVLDTAFNESIDYLLKDTSNGAEYCFSNKETEELVPAHELRVGDKVEVY